MEILKSLDYLWLQATPRVIRAAFCRQYQPLEALTIIQAFECEKSNRRRMTIQGQCQAYTMQ